MCDYGQKENTAGLSNNWHTDEKPISVDNWIQIFKQYKIDRIQVNGVEPLLYSEIDDFLIRVGATKPIFLTTNGYLIDEHLDSIRRGVQELTVSIDGIGDTHNEIRGVRDAYERATEGLDELKKIGFHRIRISFAITPRNVKEMHDVYRMAINRYKTAKIVFNHYNYIAGEVNQGYNPAAVDTAELFRQIQKCPEAVYSPRLKTLAELNAYYRNVPDKPVAAKCKILEQTLKGEHYTLISNGNFIISARCWKHMSSSEPLTDNRDFIRFHATMKFGMPAKCQRLCCAGKTV
jgi:molybdenum cofactor biosynthesis enzyme MoaA